MIFSDSLGKVTKLIEPGAIEFFIHAEANPGAEEIARSVKVTYREDFWLYIEYNNIAN